MPLPVDTEAALDLYQEVLGGVILLGLIVQPWRVWLERPNGTQVDQTVASQAAGVRCPPEIAPHIPPEVPGPETQLLVPLGTSESASPSPVQPFAPASPAEMPLASGPVPSPADLSSCFLPVQEPRLPKPQPAPTSSRYQSLDYQAGVKSLAARHYREAAAQFTRALRELPEDAVCGYCLAAAYYGLGEQRLATRAVQAAAAAERLRPVPSWGQTMQFVQGWPRVWLDRERTKLLGQTAPEASDQLPAPQALAAGGKRESATAGLNRAQAIATR